MKRATSALPNIYVALQLTDENKQLVDLSIPAKIWEYITTLSDCRQNLKHLSKFFKVFYATYNPGGESSTTDLAATTRARVTAVNSIPACKFAKSESTIISYDNQETIATCMVNKRTTSIISNDNNIVSIPAQMRVLYNRPAHKEHLPNSSTPSDSVNSVQLYNACVMGNSYLVTTSLLDNRQTLSVHKIYFTETPVHTAAQDGHASLIKALASRGIPIDTRDIVGDTPLMNAAMGGHLEAVVTLHTLGANVNSANMTRLSTPLYYAVKGNYLPIVEYLVNNGANLAHIQQFGETLLHTATNEYDDCKLLTYLLSKNTTLINYTNQSNETPLMLACRMGLYCSARTLIEHGADVNYGSEKELPFDIAYNNKNFDIAALLHSYKARHNIEIKPIDMFIAITKEDLDHIKVLLALNIKVTRVMILQAHCMDNKDLIDLLLPGKTQD
jgi:ankyrin repeat protein